MSDLLIKNAVIYTPESKINGWVRCENGKITTIGEGRPPESTATIIDANGQHLLPGFIDTHVHGAVNHDTMDADRDGLIAMADFFASRGVTAFTPTTLTSTHDKIMAALETVKTLINTEIDGASIVGVHLEGPYLNVKKTGAQNPDFVRLCDPDEAQHYLDSGVLRVVSVAPEFLENHWLIEQCKSRGITASIAHTMATYEETLAGIEAGISQSTHTYNAMTSLNHRKPGVVGAVMSDDRVNCELIADNIHVHPAAMKALWYAKGRDKISLISDAMRAAGMPEGEYKLEDLTAFVKDGKATLADGTLAGSVLTMDVAVKNFMAATGADLHTIMPTFSLNPARTIGLDDCKGSIEAGKDADFVLLGNDISVQKTIVGGRVVYQN